MSSTGGHDSGGWRGASDVHARLSLARSTASAEVVLRRCLLRENKQNLEIEPLIGHLFLAITNERITMILG